MNDEVHREAMRDHDVWSCPTCDSTETCAHATLKRRLDEGPAEFDGVLLDMSYGYCDPRPGWLPVQRHDDVPRFDTDENAAAHVAKLWGTKYEWCDADMTDHIDEDPADYPGDWIVQLPARVWANDNRWSPGSSNAHWFSDHGTKAMYAGRWIDQGDGMAGDVLPGRHGIAWDTDADREELGNLLRAWQPEVIVGQMTLARDQPTQLVDTTEFVVWVRRSGGYYYCDAWTVS